MYNLHALHIKFHLNCRLSGDPTFPTFLTRSDVSYKEYYSINHNVSNQLAVKTWTASLKDDLVPMSGFKYQQHHCRLLVYVKPIN